jgi:chemotaxis protein MotB
MKLFPTLTLSLAGAIALSGCVAKSKYVKEVQRGDTLSTQFQTQLSQNEELRNRQNQLQSDNDGLKNTNAQLMQSLEAKKGELSQRQAELIKQNELMAQKLRETEQAKEAEIAKMKSSYEELVGGLKSELEAGQVTITQLKGRLSVNMVDKVLFNSGEAQLKKEGQQVIDSVGEVLKKLKDKSIRIEGYTDNVPISSVLQSKYPSNWELSTARATAVVRYLQDKVGIAPDRLIAAGYGETHPLADNKTPEGRQQNRRIEIVLVPDEIATAPSSKPTTTPTVSVSTSTAP